MSVKVQDCSGEMRLLDHAANLGLECVGKLDACRVLPPKVLILVIALKYVECGHCNRATQRLAVLLCEVGDLIVSTLLRNGP